jgi:1-acyl-sn-glycerol-3-phosphate acyltransferase
MTDRELWPSGPPDASAADCDNRPNEVFPHLVAKADDDGDPYPHGEDDAVIRMLRAANALYARLYHKITIHIPCPIPRRGAAILISNHISGLDPVLIQACCPRLIRWMMAREYFEQKPLDAIYKTVGAIPVQRSGRDMAATRIAMRALRRGFVIGIFPEGKIETKRELLPFHSGIGLMALKTRAPVYPVCLDGTQRGKEMIPALAIRQEAGIAFGRPVTLSDLGGQRHDVELATERIQASVQHLQTLLKPPVYGQDIASL